MHVARIRPRHIRTTLDELDRSDRTITENKAILSSVLTYAVDTGIIDANPARSVRTRQGRRRRLAVPDAAGALALLAEAAPDADGRGGTWEIPLTLAVYTGMRRSEVLGLRWCDVDLEERTLHVSQGLHRIPDGDVSRLAFLPPKTDDSQREFMIGDTLAQRLRRWRAEQAERRLRVGQAWDNLDLVCDRGDGGPLDPGAFSHAFKRIAAKSGLPKTTRLHDLRHRVATELLERGVDIKIVSAMLGHSTVTFTANIYQHVRRTMTKEAADALDRALGGDVR